MGMDVYGINPTIAEGSKKPDMPDFDNITEKERSSYFDAVYEYETNNPGVYFRSNIWGWRPLWQYACDLMDTEFNEEDIAGGSVNSGYAITSDKALVLSSRLQTAIEINAHHMYERDYKAMQDALPQVECEICDGVGMRQYERDENVTELAPCNACEGTKLRDDWRKSYPFDAEFVEEFARFVKHSGGFEIR